MGYCNKYKGQNKKIITSKIEHVSVYNTFKHLEKDFDVVYLNIDEKGLIDLEQLKREMDKNVVLVSIMWVNNIIGTVQNIKEIINIVKAYNTAKLHVDCVQGICKVINDFDYDDIDMFTISAHKIYGPKGIAGLIVRKTIALEPVIFGSTAQYGLKPGTMDVALIAAFAKAMKKNYDKTLENKKYVKELWEYLYQSIKYLDGIRINTPIDNISYYILNFAILGVKGETIIHNFENKDIYISTGSACSSKLAKPEKTVYALTNSIDIALSSVRVSLSSLLNKSDIDEFVIALKELLNVR